MFKIPEISEKTFKKLIGFGSLFFVLLMVGLVLLVEKEKQEFLKMKNENMVWNRSDTNGTHTTITRYNKDGLVSVYTYKQKTITIRPDFENMTSEQIFAMYKAFKENKEK